MVEVKPVADPGLHDLPINLGPRSIARFVYRDSITDSLPLLLHSSRKRRMLLAHPSLMLFIFALLSG